MWRRLTLTRWPQLRGALSELWLHHTAVGQTALGATAITTLLTAAPVRALHLSHTPIDADGLAEIARAVTASHEAGLRLRMDRLYVNACELERVGEEAVGRWGAEHQRMPDPCRAVRLHDQTLCFARARVRNS